MRQGYTAYAVVLGELIGGAALTWILSFYTDSTPLLIAPPLLGLIGVVFHLTKLLNQK